MSTAAPNRRRNHLVWIGPLVAFAGALSYFTVFVRWPVLRDFPWVNLPLVLLGLGISIMALGRRRRDSKVSRLVAWTGALFSTLLAGLFCAYVFHFSSTLPAATAATMQMDQAPEFALQDQDGRVVRLADLRGKNAVLIFFRGFW